jgi:hypothetical protein
MFFRFVVSDRHESSDRERGILSALYKLERSGELTEAEANWFREAMTWLNANLARPDRFNWSSRPNAPERGLSWLKAEATEHVSRMRELVALLEHKGISVSELRSDRPGYILYEDAQQVVAMPFEQETF